MNERDFNVVVVDMGGGKSSCFIDENVCVTLTRTNYGEPVVCYERRDEHSVRKRDHHFESEHETP